MNSDENVNVTKKIQKTYDNGLAAIRAVAERLSPQVAQNVRTKKKREGSKHAGSNNHGQKRNKKRYLMAKESNRINRKRVKRWKN